MLCEKSTSENTPLTSAQSNPKKSQPPPDETESSEEGQKRKLHPRDITVGMRFGRMVVVSYSEPIFYQDKCECLCDCGRRKRVYIKSLTSGKTSSCGCLAIERTRQFHTIHGESIKNNKSPEYRTWSGILSRCLNKSNPGYKRYGGRGIIVCERWMDSFSNFLLDMGRKPIGCSIDRIDNDGNYEPSNCRWSNSKEQSNNTSANHIIEFNGTKKTIQQWAEYYGMNHYTLRRRIRENWPIEKCFAEPIRSDSLIHRGKKYEFESLSLTIVQWSKKTGISLSVLKYRLSKQKLSLSEVLALPVRCRK